MSAAFGVAACSADAGPRAGFGSGEVTADANPAADGALDSAVGPADATSDRATAVAPGPATDGTAGGGIDAGDATSGHDLDADATVLTSDGSGPIPEGSVDASDAGDALDAAAGDEVDGTADSVTDGGDGSADGDGSDCSLGPLGEAVELRCAGLYADWPSKTVAGDAHPYDPGLRLWSDGADKKRWVQLPMGTTIDTSNMDDWVFPIGTKFWKEFSLGGKRIETRLLWKTGGGTWYTTTYRWTADASSAVELTNGELNADGHGYEVPAQFACRGCHQGRPDFVLGFEAVSLSSPAASGVTVASLVSQGLLSAPPAARITIPGTATEAAALGYLHANCGTTCHNPESPAYNKGFYMRLSVAQLGRVQATDTWTTGWNVPTIGFPGSAGTPIRIAACDAGASSVYYRMSRRDGLGDAGPNTQMPPADTHAIDDAGVALIKAWIDEGCADAGGRDAH